MSSRGDGKSIQNSPKVGKPGIRDAQTAYYPHNQRVILSIRALIIILFSLSSVLAIPHAAADPGQGVHITDVQHVTDRWDKVSVYSPAMNKVIVNDVFKAPGSAARRPSTCCPASTAATTWIPGASFAPGTKGWFGMTDIQGFFANKNVNVVSPLGGQFSWWTNWIADRRKQYQTYMTRELPPLINVAYKPMGSTPSAVCPAPAEPRSTTAFRPRAATRPSPPTAVSRAVGPIRAAGGADPGLRWRQRGEHVGPAGRTAVGRPRPVEERREACAGSRSTRRRPAARPATSTGCRRASATTSPAGSSRA